MSSLPCVWDRYSGSQLDETQGKAYVGWALRATIESSFQVLFGNAHPTIIQKGYRAALWLVGYATSRLVQFCEKM